MENHHKIKKRKQLKEVEAKRKRGRPKSWSNSWQKRLVMLRLCGLRIEVIVELLKIMSKGCFDAKVRRAQQILNHVLSEGYQEDCPRDKAHSRNRIAFFRSLRKRSLKQRQDSIESSISPRRLSYGRNSSCSPTSSRSKTPGAYSTNPFWPLSPYIPDWAPGAHLRNNENISRMDSLSSARYSISTTTSKYDARSFMSIGSVSSNVREILQRNSYSSSLVSEIVGVLRMRFSTSTLGTQSEPSIYNVPISMNEDNIVGCMIQARRALDDHQADISMLNEAVIQGCCSQNTTCVHRDILDSSTQDGSAGASNSSLLQTRAHDVATLCFIAASGSSSEVLTTATSSLGADIHGINLDGQNFMFFLETSGFSENLICAACSASDSPTTPRFADFADVCTCQFSDQTTLFRFENLLSLLDERGFNFEHFDNEGRSFLSYLCPSRTFDINWLVAIAMRDDSWVSRLRNLSNKRDASGCFLIDYIALHPNYESLSNETLDYFRPLFRLGPEGQLPYRTLIGEDDNGATALHSLSPQSMRPFLMGLWDLQDEASNLLRNPNNLNAYDCAGMTPLLSFVHRCIENSVDEDTIITGVSLMMLWGANVNARSRNGGTILHLTAKSALPRLVSYVVSLGVQIDLVDKDGFAALDYAAKTFNRSRRRHEPPELTGRSLKSAVKLQDARRTLPRVTRFTTREGQYLNIQDKTLERYPK